MDMWRGGARVGELSAPEREKLEAGVSEKPYTGSPSECAVESSKFKHKKIRNSKKTRFSYVWGGLATRLMHRSSN